jgi:type IV pilus assembly protein PilC
MPAFAYVVKDKNGRTHSGLLETDSRQALIEQLWKQDFVVISIEECRSRHGASRAARMAVKADQLVIFSRQLATLVASGIPVLGGIDVLRDQIEDRTFKRILAKIRDDIEGGASLSESLARYPRVFSEFFVNMVKAGEASGQLDEILDRLANYLEKTESLVRKVRASLFYPALVTFMAFAITAFLVIAVVPKFKEIFASLGGQMPLPTRILMAISDGMRTYLAAEVLAMVLLVAGLRCYIGTKAGRRWFDQTKLRMPILGKLFQKVAIARFARTLATLVKAGVPILNAMEIVAKTAGNKIVEQAVMAARTSIREGQNIATPLASSKVFPPMVTRMIAVGEKTGELERMLSKIADFYENEVDAAVTGLTSLIEPLVIAFLGIVVGSIVIALFLPIFTISQLVTQ